MYFRFVTLVAFHTFLSLKVSPFVSLVWSAQQFMQVDATILEVGVGGLYDSTNVVPRPVATGVSALGLDHVNVLGKTIKEIAFNKGGIFKVIFRQNIYCSLKPVIAPERRPSIFCGTTGGGYDDAETTCRGVPGNRYSMSEG
jgi:folylpolyglutamate synthase/dihydropteroate synthase